MSTRDASKELRTRLVNLKPTGADGFEGLVRSCLESLTGVPLRLARAGSQFGRDASSSPTSEFGIAMEAKRYDNPLGLEVAAKALVASGALGGTIDLWIISATVEIGDDVVVKTAELLEQSGISLMVLDWANQQIPRLATLLAHNPEATLRWWKECAPQSDDVEVSSLLSAIQADPSFADAAASLKDECKMSIVGLATLKQFANNWMKTRLHSPTESKRSFGQYLSVLDQSRYRVTRPSSDSQLAQSILGAWQGNTQATPDARACVVALLGEEGTGKSWSTVCWWAAQNPERAPILIFLSGRRVNLLDQPGPIDALAVIARLIADQENRSDSARIAQWYRRLQRWSRSDRPTTPRFVIVLDGINEHPNLPWADLVVAYAEAARSLGGLAVVTSRPGFWNSHLLPRLGQSVVVVDALLGSFTDEELRTYLKSAKVDASSLSHALREFMRNPRVASVAVQIIHRLDLEPAELTKERLLLEYWQQRVEERGNLQVHSARDFEALLTSHARAWLQRKHNFSLDKWVSHSGLAQRDDTMRVAGDMTDIAEGRFFQPVEGRPEKYTFRKEALPFAIGLLLFEEIREELDSTPNRTPEEIRQLIETAIAPVSGFDELGEAFAAAIVLALRDESYSDIGRDALVIALLDLQNVGRPITRLLSQCIALGPSFFLNWMEKGRSDGIEVHDHYSLVRAILYVRDLPRVAASLEEKTTMWLTRWSLEPRSLQMREGARDHYVKRIERSIETLETFSASEREYLDRATRRTERADSAFLTRAAVIFKANRPLEGIASHLLPWAMASMVNIDLFAAVDDLRWICLLNRHDPKALADVVNRSILEVAPEEVSMSHPMRVAVSAVLNLTGYTEQADRADQIYPVTRSSRWRLAEKYCETDPYDPDSTRCGRLDLAISEIQVLPSQELWACNGQTQDDNTLELICPALCRFEPEVVVKKLRQVLASATTRDAAALFSLAIQLQWLAPLVDGETAKELRRSISHVLLALRGTESGKAGQRDWYVLTQFVSLCLRHLESAEQIALLAELPSDMPMSPDLQRYLKPVPSQLLEDHLQGGAADTGKRWALFAAASAGFEVTAVLRSQLTTMLRSSSSEIVTMAAHAIGRADDPQLDVELLNHARTPDGALGSNSTDLHVTPALSLVALRSGHSQLLQSLDTSLLYVAASRFGSEFQFAYDVSVREILKRYSFGSQTYENLEKGFVVGGSYDTPDGALRRIMEFPSANALRAFAASHIEESCEWCRLLLNDGNSIVWMRIGTFAVALAGALAPYDGALASAVLHRGVAEQFNRRVVIDGVDVLSRACFARAHELGALQTALLMDPLCDFEIESALRAAEAAGAQSRIDAITSSLFESEQPGRIARALAIEGLRSSETQLFAVGAFGVAGVLHSIAQWSLRQALRHKWMVHWLKEAASSESCVDVWRFGTLASDLADSRFRQSWRELEKRSPTFDLFAPMLWERSLMRAERRQQKRKDTLFGLKSPPEDLRIALRD